MHITNISLFTLNRNYDDDDDGGGGYCRCGGGLHGDDEVE